MSGEKLTKVRRKDVLDFVGFAVVPNRQGMELDDHLGDVIVRRLLFVKFRFVIGR